MMRFALGSIFALLLAIGCSVQTDPTAASSTPALAPWEPIDPGFAGCEGG